MEFINEFYETGQNEKRTGANFMSLLMEKLNDAQKEAACEIDRHVRIVAGAGSGKTSVLMARIEYLINELGIWPNRIMAITFTNKAAQEMKDRLASAIGFEDARHVRISTIHSLCARILREDSEAANLPKNFTIMDTEDQKTLLRPIFKELSTNMDEITHGQAVGYISSNKTGKVSPQMAHDMAHNQRFKQLADVYEEYEKRRQEMKAVDFDDLLLETEKLLKNDEEVRTKWQNRLDFIHVDEFQDIDPIQYQIIKSLVREDANLCVVGDPDQTIYTWRGASVDIILQFHNDFKPCHTVILNENYRSTQNILSAANEVIENNSKRIKKDLFTKLGEGEKITLYEAQEEEREPMYIARQINELSRAGIPYKDMAILYRSNYLSRNVEKVLRSIHIPHRIYGGIRYYDRAEIKDVLSYLRLLAAPDENDPKRKSLDLAVLRVINQPKRGIGARTIEKLSEEARKRDMNLLDVMGNSQTLSPAASKKAQKFYETIQELKDEMKTCELPDLIDAILDYTGYEDMLLEAKEDERLENVKELKQDLALALQNDPNTTLESYLQDISLYTDKNRDDEESDNMVSLMTVHAAKGTEFPVVFISGFNEDVFPSRRSIEEGGAAALEEERRLLYVAMTRAKQRLFITWNNGINFIDRTHRRPSRFLQELTEEYIVDDSRSESSEEQNSNQKTNTHSTKANSALRNRKARRGVHYRKGDKVDHTIYGEGVIVSVDKDIASIAFPYPIGTKKINTNHPTLSKVKADQNSTDSAETESLDSAS